MTSNVASSSTTTAPEGRSPQPAREVRRLTPAAADVATWSRAGPAAYQLSLGLGVVHVLGGEHCPLAHVSAVLNRAAGESAGQCGPCMFGVPAVADDVRALATSDQRPATTIRRHSPVSGTDWGPCPGAVPAGSPTEWPVTHAVPFAHSPRRSRPMPQVGAPPPVPRGGPVSALDNRRDRPLREDRQPQAMAVDRVACTGHGVCVCLLPEAISPDEWGYPVMLAPHVDPELGGIRPGSARPGRCIGRHGAPSLGSRAEVATSVRLTTPGPAAYWPIATPATRRTTWERSPWFPCLTFRRPGPLAQLAELRTFNP